MQQQQHNHHHHHHHDAQAPDQPCPFFCPRGHARSALEQFDVNNLPKSIWCSACKGSHASISFRCTCSHLWHRCPDHFATPTLAVQRQTAAKSLALKRPAPVDAETSQRKLTRLEPNLASRPCLGPVLSARFPPLVSEGARQRHSLHRELESTQGQSSGTQSH